MLFQRPWPRNKNLRSFFGHHLKCDATNLEAGSPATGPKAAVATGTSLNVLATDKILT